MSVLETLMDAVEGLNIGINTVEGLQALKRIAENLRKTLNKSIKRKNRTRWTGMIRI